MGSRSNSFVDLTRAALLLKAGKMAEPEHRSFFPSYPEALLIVILTAGMYWASFVHEVAYFNSYGVPAHLVQVNLHTMFLVTPMMTALAIPIILGSALMRSYSLPTRRKGYRIFAILSFPMVYIVNYGLRSEDWLIYAGILAGVALFEFAWPVLFYRNRATLADRLLAHEEALNVGIPASVSLVILMFLLGTYAAYIHGQAIAQKQTRYLVFDDAPDVAVVRVYSDSILAVPFDRTTRTVKSQVVIRKIGTDSSIGLTYVNIGPLRLPFISIKLTVS